MALYYNDRCINKRTVLINNNFTKGETNDRSTSKGNVTRTIKGFSL